MKNHIIRQIIRLFSGSLLITRNEGKMKFRPLSSLDQELEDLVRLFSGLTCPVFLVGGVGLAVRFGKFYRNHKDFDLSIYIDDVVVIRKYLKQQSYNLVRRSFRIKIAPDVYIEFYKPFEFRSIKKLYAGKHVVKLLNGDRAKKLYVPRRLDLMDLLLLGRSDEGVYDFAYKIMIPWNDFLPADVLSENSSLQLPNINYRKYVPAYTERSQDDLIRVGLNPDQNL
jgi:hypothetical protein